MTHLWLTPYEVYQMCRQHGFLPCTLCGKPSVLGPARDLTPGPVVLPGESWHRKRFWTLRCEEHSHAVNRP